MPDKSIYGKRSYSADPAPRQTHETAQRSHPFGLRYAELRCKSNFSFLRGASHPEQLAQQAAQLGYHALAITDRNTLAGIVRMHCAAKACDLPLLIGAELTPIDAPPITLYVTNRAAYGRLCRIITQGRLRAKKGECHITLNDIAEHNEGLLATVHGNTLRKGTERRSDEATKGNKKRDTEIENVRRYRDIFGDRLYLSAGVHGGSDDDRMLARIDALAHATSVSMVATNDVYYHDPTHRFLQDVLTCIRHRCKLDQAGTRLFANAERHLKPIDQMQRIFADYPQAIARTVEIADRCTFSLDELRYEYPEALCPPDRLLPEYLAELTWAGAKQRYPDGIPDKVRHLIEHELVLIRELDYEPYFLTVWDIVRFARSRNILCQGRGSAANSAVCYCLEITSVDPDRIDLLFERFVSAERNEPPDIDVDFEHERREEVFQYIYNKYGREHAGIVAEVITYRARSAIRDVGKTLGLSLDRIDALAKKHEWWDTDALPEPFLREVGFDPSDRTLRMLRKLVRQIHGFPRHLSQHVGGFVITRGPLCEMVPIENAAMPDRTFIEWDKDDIDALGMLKIDCLALGMLTAIRKCLAMINERSDEVEQKGHRGEGTKGRRRCDEAMEREDTHIQNWREPDAEEPHSSEDVSRSDCVAKGDGTGQGYLPRDRPHARHGTVRPDDPNAKSSRVHSLKHRRRARPPKPNGVPSVSPNRTRFADGVADANDSRERAPSHSRLKAAGRPASGDRSSLTGPDPKSRETPKIALPPSTHSLTPMPSSPASPPVSLSPSSSIPEPVPTKSGSLFPSVSSSPASSLPSSLSRSVAPSLSLSSIPPEDPAVYDMICQADTVGVFQIESRAQMSMLPRLRPRHFYDLVIEVAIVRPGPIQGGMVHPYLRRRDGREPVVYPNDAIKSVLHRTLGVPLFQEQAMRLAVVAAGFTPGEADQLRRAMAAWRLAGDITRFRTKLITGMRANGLSAEFAERCFKQICGFGEYGFPESHAASFALLVYVSAWLKRYHPAAFCASILNSLPMGFYQPAQLVRDAKEHGVDIQPVDVNFSGYDCRLEATERRSDEATQEETKGRRGDDFVGTSSATKEETEGRERFLCTEPRASARANPPTQEGGTEGKQIYESDVRSLPRPRGSGPSTRPPQPTIDNPQSWGLGGPAVRLGMRLVKGISRVQVEGIEQAQRDRPFISVVDLAHRSGASRATLARLAAADAMRSMGLDRRHAVWQVLALGEQPPMLEGHDPPEPKPDLPSPSLANTVQSDYETVGLSLNAHPISLVRDDLTRADVRKSSVLSQARQGEWIQVGGLVLVRQRPSTASGIVFCTLEDETGVANLVIRPAIYEKYRSTARGAVALVAQGRVEREGQVVHLQTFRLTDMSKLFEKLRSVSRDFH